MRKNSIMKKAFVVGMSVLLANMTQAQQNEYENRFLLLRDKINNPANGYFSKDGVPYHSPETIICEAPDYGHETTSEAYSYWIWMEAMYGKIKKDWAPLNSAWTKMENFAIPTNDLQPTAGDYKPSAPATYASEFPLPSNYPAQLISSVPVGQDPVSAELTSTYGNSYVYGMHWLFDCDNFYGYGKKGDGVSTPSYINTFQRGVQESVWETIPQPSWEDFKWGANDGSGYLKLFTAEANAPSKQWKYTNAPDADARVVQAMYWAAQWAKAQGLNAASVIPTAKAAKMGDYLRLAMFDKYFKPMGAQSQSAPGATGYQSAHYLLSWYYAWGGPLTAQGWAWRVGCSHSHFGYQNPVAAYALSAVPELTPKSPNAARDWGTSLNRQLEFYQWLQSAEGAIAGGATNSWNGQYDAYPAGTTTFYNMAYVTNPVYEDPGSNTWFGFQAWSMERVAEYYYMTGNARAKTVLDKWVAWVKTVTRLLPDGTYEIPSEIGWSGKPNTWNAAAPVANAGLHVTVVSNTQDVGIAACLAKALTYYAAATQKFGTLDAASRDLAKAILDRMWTNYYEPTGKGVASSETRTDYTKFLTAEVYVPAGWSGKMPNGDVIQPGIKFIDIRSKYKQDPGWAALQAALTSGTGYTTKYHRFWAQTDIALANAEFGNFFGGTTTGNIAPTVSITAPANNASFAAPATIAIAATAADADGTVANVQFFNGATLLGTDATAPYTFSWTAVAAGSYTITAKATDNAGAVTTSTAVMVTVGTVANTPPTVSITAPLNNATFTAPATIAIAATAADANGTVTNVQFFNGATLLGTDATAPYTFSWTAVPAGTYVLTAKATDNAGAVTTSAPVTITVGTIVANIPPTVSITAPLNNATFTAPATIAIAASAADVDGTVTNVQFFNGATLLNTDATAPYTFSWAAVAAGTYVLTAKATDNAGAVTTSAPITITVTGVVTSTADIIGPDCGSNNSTLTFEVNPAKRVNVSTYNWWFTGSAGSTTPVAGAPYSVTIQTGGYFSAGQVCVGMNLTAAPWYTNFCKSITKCAAAATLSPNPSSVVTNLTVSEAVNSYTISNYMGIIVAQGGTIAKDATVNIGSSLTSGTYALKIVYRSGRVESKIIQKVL